MGDCPRKAPSVATDGLGQYLLENALEEKKGALRQKVVKFQGASFEEGVFLAQGSFEDEASREPGSLQSLGKSCGRVG